MFDWQAGRQSSGYLKLRFIQITWPIKFDCYLLKFPVGSYVPIHRDHVEAGNHFRLNITLNPSSASGHIILGKCIYSSKRIKLFRPDLTDHGFSKVLDKTIYMLSVGWVR